MTARGPHPSRQIDEWDIAFRLRTQRRHLGQIRFRGSIARLHMPLSTLHTRPHGRPYMTRGRRGWLGLHRTTLSFATSHRFIPALRPFIVNHNNPRVDYPAGQIALEICKFFDTPWVTREYVDGGEYWMPRRAIALPNGKGYQT